MYKRWVKGRKCQRKLEKDENLVKQALVITWPTYCCVPVKRKGYLVVSSSHIYIIFLPCDFYHVLISYFYLSNLIFLPWDFRLSLLTGFALLEIFPVLLLCWHHSASLPVRSTLSHESWTFREDAIKGNLLAVSSGMR